jgi:hypothetical protein
MHGPSSSHLGLIVACLILRRLSGASAPARCSTRGLGGMSYPFKGLELSEWVYLGKMRGRVRQLLL